MCINLPAFVGFLAVLEAITYIEYNLGITIKKLELKMNVNTYNRYTNI